MAGKTSTIVAVLAGAAVGAALGVLFAPDEGKKTRKKIKDGATQKADEFKHKVSDFTESVKSKFGYATQDIEAGLDKLVSNVEDKAEEVIATLEKKLDELKSATKASAN